MRDLPTPLELANALGLMAFSFPEWCVPHARAV